MSEIVNHMVPHLFMCAWVFILLIFIAIVAGIMGQGSVSELLTRFRMFLGITMPGWGCCSIGMSHLVWNQGGMCSTCGILGQLDLFLGIHVLV